MGTEMHVYFQSHTHYLFQYANFDLVKPVIFYFRKEKSLKNCIFRFTQKIKYKKDHFICCNLNWNLKYVRCAHSQKKIHLIWLDD